MGENFIRTRGSQGFIVNEYQGKYSINAAWEGKDGKVNMNWALEQVKQGEYKEKATPVKVKIGDKENAEQALLMALREITGKTYVQVSDDVPDF